MYVDPPLRFVARDTAARRVGAKHGHRWCHLFTDGPVEQLHAFAARIGLRREWFQDEDPPHYDLTPPRRERALLLGAIPVARRQAVLIWRALREARHG